MAGSTNIEWTDASWNPIAGCSVISPGCTNCYAMKMAARVEAMSAALGRTSPYDGLTIKTKAGAVWNGKMRLVDSALTQPIYWRKPRKIFVNSMSDLFHDDVPDAWIDQVVAVMHLTPRHTYQILTKRSARMRAYFEGLDKDLEERLWATGMYEFMNTPSAPFANVLLGASVEDQVRADERRQSMAEIAAAGWRTFVSYEPALGEVDWTDWEFLSWLIAGGESGRSARPVHPDWIRIARDWCAEHGIAFLFKQWGEWAPGEANSLRKTLAVDCAYDDGDGSWTFDRITAAEGAEMHVDDEPAVWRIGKRHSGNLLDGVQHLAFPQVAHG